MKCRFINTGANSAYANMAIDEAILRLCKTPILRVYWWKPPAISIGYSQDAGKEVNLKKCAKSKIAVVRRITGGKAVLHEKEATYSFILPENMQLLPKGITESYRAIAQALVLAFRKIGINAEIKKQRFKAATPLCFNSLNWYELTVNNKKISGSAQKRTNGKILQHGSLLADFDYGGNYELFGNCNGFNDAENLKKKITSIKNELNADVSFSELAEAIKYGFQKNFDFDFFEGPLTMEEKILAEQLERKKYSTEEWNFNNKGN